MQSVAGGKTCGGFVPVPISLKRRLATIAALWLHFGMLRRIARLFLIKTRFEACAIIYALALGAVMRGSLYLREYPGTGGVLLFTACLGAVFMAGAKLLEVTRPYSGERRRSSDRRSVSRQD